MEYTADSIFKTMILSNCAKSLETGLVMLSSFDNKEVDFVVKKYLGILPKLLRMDWNKLVGLQTLNLGNTPITSLPAEIGNLVGLQTLDLRYTQITSLPSEIGNLTALNC